jgi:hypothetical protein
MHCTSCGAVLEPGSAFCGSCGAPVPVVTAEGPLSPPPLAGAAAATVPLPVAVEQPRIPAPVYAPPPQTLYQAQAAAPPARRGLSTGGIVGIVAGVLVLLLLVCGGGYLAYVALFGGMPSTPTTTVQSSKPAVPKPSTPAAEPAPAQKPSDAVVTEAEARDVVNRFLALRAAGDINGSKALCTAKMMAGPDADFVNDKYWNPDSWELTKFTPDLMYIHVTSMGVWPSGREATIFQVYREPESGKVLIDGFLDAEMFPELVTP